MQFTPDARGTEYFNSVPNLGTEFQNDHEFEAQGMYFSLGPRDEVVNVTTSLVIKFLILSLPVQN